MRRFFLAIIATAMAITVSASPIIPAPKAFVKQEGSFTITSNTQICYEADELLPLAKYLSEYIKVSQIAKGSKSGSISLQYNKLFAEEEYRLAIAKDGIKIAAGGYGGVFNAIQSLLQLLPSQIYKKEHSLPLSVECCKVGDAPRYAYRGFMIDVARTWMPKEWILRYIDYIAYHKINKLHLHLTDSQGWRIEIKSHPELAQKGGFRGGKSLLPASMGKWEERYGGYYTQEDIREIVTYAAVRNIEVIPEIDLPGHTQALLRVHPEMSCKDKNGKQRRWGAVVCPTNNENYKLIEDVIAELAALFPSQHIHIGGDEVNFKSWKECPSCSVWLQEHNAKHPRVLESYFLERVHNIVTKYGKKSMAWYFGGTLPQDVTVQGWQSINQCIRSAERGHRTIVMPASPFYLDIYQGEHEPGFQSRKYFDVKQLYLYDIDGNISSPKAAENIYGIEAPFWSEIFLSQGGDKSMDYIEYMTFPRLCGVAEQGWGKNGDSWEDFYTTLVKYHYDRMSAMGINFRLTPPTVKYEEGKLTASVSDNSTIYYKREGVDEQIEYNKAVTCKKPAEYIFWSEYNGIKSFESADASHYATIQPKVVMTSSVKENPKLPYSRISEYHKYHARTSKSCKKGDWFLFEFETPIKCRAIEFRTGHKAIPNRIIYSGYLEVSKDGKTFTRAGELKNGRIKLVNPNKPIKAARLVYNGTYKSVVDIWAPLVYPKK